MNVNLRYVSPPPESITVYYKDTELGEIIMCEDGYYKFFPIVGCGVYWTEDFLTDITSKLKELNKDWEKLINDTCNS